MNKIIATLLLAFAAMSAFAVAGCTDTYQAQQAALYTDKPAAITCYTYGEITFEGFSTGKVEYDEGGRVSFVDQANHRYTVVEGDCRIVYAR